jgi:hypothetical protein
MPVNKALFRRLSIDKKACSDDHGPLGVYDCENDHGAGGENDHAQERDYDFEGGGAPLMGYVIGVY